MINFDFIRSMDIEYWLLLAVAGIILIYSYWHFRKQRFVKILFFIRLMIIASVLTLLLQPELEIKRSLNLPRAWYLFYDNSLSMGYHQNNSLAALNNGLNELHANILKRDIFLKVFSFSQDIQERYSEPEIIADGTSTDMGKVISQISHLNPSFSAGAIIVSDGQPTQGIDPTQATENINIPIFTIGVGDTTPMIDVSIHSVDVPTVAVKGEDLTLSIIITSTGDVNQRGNVILLDGDKPIGSKIISIRGQGSRQEVRFQFQPQKLGVNTYDVITSSLKDEINVQNNRHRFDVTILKDKYQVALITGRPNYNTAVIKNIIGKQGRIALTHFIQVNDDFRPDIKQFWETKFDLIIFDNFPVTPISAQWQRVFGRKLIAHQSSLAWIVGPDITQGSGQSLYPFFHLKPYGEVFDKQKYYSWYFSNDFHSSSIGVNISPGNIPPENQLPPLHPGLQVEGNDPAINSQLFLSGPVTIPLVLYGEIEGLRSWVWTSNGLSRLYYNLTGSKYRSFAEQYLTSNISWLLRMVGTEQLFFRLNKDIFQQGEAIIVTGNMVGGTGKLTPSKAFIRVYRDTKRVSSAELVYNSDNQRWEGELWAAQPGHYNYEITVEAETNSAVQSGSFRVSEGQIELNRVFVNRSGMEGIAANTNGEYYPWNQRFNLMEHLNPEETITIKRYLIRFGEQYLVLILILGLLTAEWLIRRRYGLQ